MLCDSICNKHSRDKMAEWEGRIVLPEVREGRGEMDMVTKVNSSDPCPGGRVLYPNYGDGYMKLYM